MQHVTGHRNWAFQLDHSREDKTAIYSAGLVENIASQAIHAIMQIIPSWTGHMDGGEVPLHRRTRSSSVSETCTIAVAVAVLLIANTDLGGHKVVLLVLQSCARFSTQKYSRDGPLEYEVPA